MIGRRAKTNSHAILMLDSPGLVVTWNEGAERLEGPFLTELIEQSMVRFYPAEDVAAGTPAQLLALAAADGRCEDEGWRARQDVPDVVLTALPDTAGELTGLRQDCPIGVLVMGRIDQALERAARRKEPLALLLIDLDNFEKVYDSLDYHAGDELAAHGGAASAKHRGGRVYCGASAATNSWWLLNAFTNDQAPYGGGVLPRCSRVSVPSGSSPTISLLTHYVVPKTHLITYGTPPEGLSSRRTRAFSRSSAVSAPSLGANVKVAKVTRSSSSLIGLAQVAANDEGAGARCRRPGSRLAVSRPRWPTPRLVGHHERLRQQHRSARW